MINTNIKNKYLKNKNKYEHILKNKTHKQQLYIYIYI